MRWTLLIACLILWLLGLIGSIFGQWIHVLLIIAVILLVLQLRRDKQGIGNG